MFSVFCYGDVKSYCNLVGSLSTYDVEHARGRFDACLLLLWGEWTVG